MSHADARASVLGLLRSLTSESAGSRLIAVAHRAKATAPRARRSTSLCGSTYEGAEAKACKANTYESPPKPAMVPVATGATTETDRNVSRAAGLDR